MMLLCRSSAWRSEKSCKAVGHCFPTHAVIAWLLRASPGKRLASWIQEKSRHVAAKPYAVQSSCLEISHYNHIGIYCVSIFLTILVKSCQVHRSLLHFFWDCCVALLSGPRHTVEGNHIHFDGENRKISQEDCGSLPCSFTSTDRRAYGDGLGPGIQIYFGCGPHPVTVAFSPFVEIPY